MFKICLYDNLNAYIKNYGTKIIECCIHLIYKKLIIKVKVNTHEMKVVLSYIETSIFINNIKTFKSKSE